MCVLVCVCMLPDLSFLSPPPGGAVLTIRRSLSSACPSWGVAGIRGTGRSPAATCASAGCAAAAPTPVYDTLRRGKKTINHVQRPRCVTVSHSRGRIHHYTIKLHKQLKDLKPITAMNKLQKRHLHGVLCVVSLHPPAGPTSAYSTRRRTSPDLCDRTSPPQGHDWAPSSVAQKEHGVLVDSLTRGCKMML